MRYAAFISYNHRDRKIANWLHRALETYRIPARLRGRDTAVGILGTRLPPMFQDREELAASSDLAVSVQAALREAASLIVICSPAGARSKWVNEEIRAFTAMGRRDRIQCLIVGGEPNASRTAGADPALECLPPALFEDGGGEPLAADIRADQDSRSAARLKLIAGITAVGYDELRQREQARRQRRLAVFATVFALAFVAMSALAIFALLSRDEAIAQRDRARRQTLIAERTVDFVKSMFSVASPSESRGETITAREIVDRGAARIDRELGDEPTVKADLGTTLGEVYTGLGLLHRGDAIISRMLAVPGVDPGTRVRQYLALAETRVAEDDDARAVPAYARALALARDPRSTRADLVPPILAGMGASLTSLGGRDQEARRDILTALTIDRRRGAAGEVDMARDLETLATHFYFTGDLAAARRAFQVALAIRLRRQGELHPLAIKDVNQLGSVAYAQGKTADALTYFRTVVPLYEKVLGPTDPEIASALNNLGRLEIESRDFTSAVPQLRRALSIELGQSMADAGGLVFPYGNYGLALRGTGDVAGATAMLEKARAIAEARHHRNLAPVLVDLADIACESGGVARGAALLDEARPVMARDYPSDPWRSAWLETIDARCLLARGDRDGARRLIAKARPALTKRWSPETLYGARFRQIEMASA